MSQVLKDYQFYIVTVIQLSIAAGVYLWTRTVPTKAEVAKVQKNVEGVGERVSLLEQLVRQSPDHDDISNLKIEMERTRGQMATFTAELRGAQQTMSAQVEAVRDSTSRVESTARLLLENALERGR